MLLDAAAFVPTNRLDLSRWHPDYVVLSFYKMFGYPTGVGALLVRHSALSRLHRPWFAGGTITVASVQADRHYLAAGGSAFEDGTLNFLSIPAIDLGLTFLESVGMDAIHDHVEIPGLDAHRTTRGSAPRQRAAPGDAVRPGDDGPARGDAAFNFVGPDGQHLDPRVVERLANQERISLRTGCFCNPGVGEVSLGLSKPELEACFISSPHRMSFEDFGRCVVGKGSGAVRVSLGLASNLSDVQAMTDFARRLLEPITEE